MWEGVKKRFPVWARVRGVVLQHCPFGVFVDLGDPEVKGLIEVPEFRDDDGKMIQYPPVGASVEAVVIGHMTESQGQIWLSARPC